MLKKYAGLLLALSMQHNAQAMSHHGIANIYKPFEMERSSATGMKIQFSVKNLSKQDANSLSDPLVLVYRYKQNGLRGAETTRTHTLTDAAGHSSTVTSHMAYTVRNYGSIPIHQWQLIGRTEKVDDARHTEFLRPFVYYSDTEKPEKLMFMLIDQDGTSPDTGDCLGYTIIEDNELLNFVNESVEKRLMIDDTKMKDFWRRSSRIKITPEPFNEDDKYETLCFNAKGLNMPKMDFGISGKVDPYLKFYKVLPSGDRILLERSSVIIKDYDPKWGTLKITLSKHDIEYLKDFPVIQVEAWDRDRNSSDDFIGSFELNLEKLYKNKNRNLEFGLEKDSKTVVRTKGVFKRTRLESKVILKYLKKEKSADPFSRLAAYVW